MLTSRLTFGDRRTVLLLILGLAAGIYVVLSRNEGLMTVLPAILPTKYLNLMRDKSNDTMKQNVNNTRNNGLTTVLPAKELNSIRNKFKDKIKLKVEKTTKNSLTTVLPAKDLGLMGNKSNGTRKKKVENNWSNLKDVADENEKQMNEIKMMSKSLTVRDRRAVILLILGLAVGLYFVFYYFKDGSCPYTLDLPQDEILEKVTSYEFPGIHNYVQDLFPISNEQDPPRDPVFVSGFSSNHYEEGLAMIFNFNKMINVNKTRKLIIYNIGFTQEEAKQVATECECEVRNFPFDKFPDHVSILKAYAWKPLVIQLVAKEHRFVVWLDASIRLKTTNIEDMLQRARQHGVLATRGGSVMGYQTSIETFRYLNETPCLYRGSPETETNFVFIYQTNFIKKYVMIPWVSCALIRGCMVPYKDVYKILDCSGPRVMFHCHRFEQSVLGILINRLFHRTITNHYLNGKYYEVCRECKEKKYAKE